jgi:peptidoglycan/xylan/chitin deacetylase (PgdA/CDA1 family)
MVVRGGFARFVGLVLLVFLVLPTSLGLVSAAPIEPVSIAPTGQFQFHQGEAGCGRVALIFNMGSGYEPATSILNTLANYGVRATMFPMGWFAEARPDILQWMSANGHVIGSHGYLGPELTLRTDWDVSNDIATSSSAIANAIGYWPAPWFTPFAGAADARVRALAAEQGYTTVSWGVSSNDWSFDATASSVYSNVMDNVYDGAIVELHFDSPTTTYSTAEALPWIIEDLSARGYSLVTVPELAQAC